MPRDPILRHSSSDSSPTTAENSSALSGQSCCAPSESSRFSLQPYHPEGNAINERSHRTLNSMLRARLLEGPSAKAWVDKVPGIMLTLNAMPHKPHGFSASMIATGQRFLQTSTWIPIPPPPLKTRLRHSMRVAMWFLLPSDGTFRRSSSSLQYYLTCQGRRVVLRGGDVTLPPLEHYLNWVYETAPLPSRARRTSLQKNHANSPER